MRKDASNQGVHFTSVSEIYLLFQILVLFQLPLKIVEMTRLMSEILI